MEWSDSHPDYRSDADSLLKQMEVAAAEKSKNKAFEAKPDHCLDIEDTW